MGESETRIEAPPETVFAGLLDHVLGGDQNPRLGDRYHVAGTTYTHTLTLVERPHRLGWVTHDLNTPDMAVEMEYTILPEGTGSRVRVEADMRSNSIVVSLASLVLEGRSERDALNQLKSKVEAAAQSQPPAGKT